jgi:hypothetical protein
MRWIILSAAILSVFIDSSAVFGGDTPADCANPSVATLCNALAAACTYDEHIEALSVRADFDRFAPRCGDGAWSRLTDESFKWCHSTDRFLRRIIRECTVGTPSKARHYLLLWQSSLEHHVGLQADYVARSRCESVDIALGLLGELVSREDFRGTSGQVKSRLLSIAYANPPASPSIAATPIALLALADEALADAPTCR